MRDITWAWYCMRLYKDKMIFHCFLGEGFGMSIDVYLVNSIETVGPISVPYGSVTLWHFWLMAISENNINNQGIRRSLWFGKAEQDLKLLPQSSSYLHWSRPLVLSKLETSYSARPCGFPSGALASSHIPNEGGISAACGVSAVEDTQGGGGKHVMGYHRK